MNKKAEIDFGDMNWGAFAAVYLICVAMLISVKTAFMYKLIIMIVFAPILFFIMRHK